MPIMQPTQIMPTMHTMRATDLPIVQTKETIAVQTGNLIKMLQKTSLLTITPEKTVMLLTITAADTKKE